MHVRMLSRQSVLDALVMRVVAAGRYCDALRVSPLLVGPTSRGGRSLSVQLSSDVLPVRGIPCGAAGSAALCPTCVDPHRTAHKVLRRSSRWLTRRAGRTSWGSYGAGGGRSSPPRGYDGGVRPAPAAALQTRGGAVGRASHVALSRQHVLQAGRGGRQAGDGCVAVSRQLPRYETTRLAGQEGGAIDDLDAMEGVHCETRWSRGGRYR
jgi:hypothetical protein